jgi:MFS family permease
MEYIFSNMPFTLSHLLMIISLFLIRSIEGAETLSLSLGLETYKVIYKLSQEEFNLMIFVIFLGGFIGCVISTLLGDIFSRKQLLRIGCFLIIFYGILSITSKNIIIFTLSQHLVNMGIGILLATTTALITESFNREYRGFVLNLVLLSNSVGEIYISFCLDYSLHPDDHHLKDKYEISKLFLFVISPVNKK